MEAPLQLDEKLLREATRLAETTGRSLDAVVEDALRDLLARRQRTGGVAQAGNEPIPFPTFARGKPKINLDCNREWRDQLDEGDPDFTLESLKGDDAPG